MSPTEEQILRLAELKRLCEIEAGWEPPQEYLDEWVKAALGLYRQGPNLVRIAIADEKIAGYCLSVRKLHNHEGALGYLEIRLTVNG
jgi:hypothetical protein